MSGHSHGHPHAPGQDPFLADDMPERWEAWAHLLDPATTVLDEALLDAAHVTAGTHVLDAACGTGPTTAAAHGRGADVLGIDLHPDMIERARRRHPGVHFEQGDMMDLPGAPGGAGGWDAVVCRLGAHHVDSDAWFRHVRDHLRPGGRIAIAEWGTGAEVPLFPRAHHVDGEPHMAFARTPQGWADALTAAGFKDVAVERVDVEVAFGDEATWHRFLAGVHGLDAEDAARTDAHLQDGVQHNAAYVVAGAA